MMNTREKLSMINGMAKEPTNFQMATVMKVNGRTI